MSCIDTNSVPDWTPDCSSQEYLNRCLAMLNTFTTNGNLCSWVKRASLHLSPRDAKTLMDTAFKLFPNDFNLQMEANHKEKYYHPMPDTYAEAIMDIYGDTLSYDADNRTFKRRISGTWSNIPKSEVKSLIYQHFPDKRCSIREILEELEDFYAWDNFKYGAPFDTTLDPNRPKNARENAQYILERGLEILATQQQPLPNNVTSLDEYRTHTPEHKE